MKAENFQQPILIDVFKINSEKENQYDLPIWFLKVICCKTNFKYNAALNFFLHWAQLTVISIYGKKQRGVRKIKMPRSPGSIITVFIH